MHHLPTQIAGVEIIRASTLKLGDREQPSATTQPAPPNSWPVRQRLQARQGLTAEFSYLRTRPVQRRLRCLAGELFVAVADIRVGSPTFGHWQGFYLRQGDARTLHVPAGVACGWQVTSTNARLEQRLSQQVEADAWRWLRWNDLELAVAWPEIPERMLRHSRPSRSLATLPERALPGMRAAATSVQATQTADASNSQPLPTPSARGSMNSPAAAHPSTATSTASAAATQAGRPLILVIGSSGQLGRDLCRHLSRLGTVIGACRTPERGSLLPVPVQVDVSRPASLRQAIRRVKPTLIVNAAGLTHAERAETEPRLAQLVNATAPALIADEAKRIGASIIHFCTEMVFDGSGERPWRECDTPQPLNQLGRSKLLGTEAIRHSAVPHLILRAGWLYSRQGSNYITRLVDLLTYRNSINLAVDHYGTPTSTDWLAGVTRRILSNAPSDHFGDWLQEHGGLFHVAPLGYASRVDVGDQVVATCRAHALPIVSSKLQPVPLSTLSRQPALPANCRLDCSKLGLRFGIRLPRWQAELQEQLAMLLDAGTLHGLHVA